MKLFTSFIVLILVFGWWASALGASAWVFTMNDTVSVSTQQILLSDLSSQPVPANVANLNVGHGGLPGSVQLISRKTVLRHLVSAGLAGGASFRGATSCVVLRTGETLNPHALRPEIRKALQPLVPGSKPGAPATWFELEMPRKLGIVDDSNFKVRVSDTSQLTPGRNQISIALEGPETDFNFPVTVILHQFSETAQARLKIKRGDPLLPELFQWQWTDLAGKTRKTDFHGRDSLLGVSCARTIQAGDYLRRCDLKPTPVVYAGDRVELQIQRGGLSVSVKATARKEGSIGQTIPVRNELNKQLVNARVVGPGLVKWRN